MPASGKSRWADSEEDAELEIKIRLEKEEKRRKKAEKARKLGEEKQAAAAASRAEDDTDDRPTKRRKLTPEPVARAGGNATSGAEAPAKLLRFETGSWGRSNRVDTYDKLNDIEEGTYGWVARATQRATGKVVALKRLKFDPADRSGLPVTGLREIQILHDCKHRNVVTLEEVVVGNNVNKMDKHVSPVAGFLTT